MWQLLKAELNYSKSILIIAYGSVLLIGILLIVGPQLFLVPEIPLVRKIRVLLWIILFFTWIAFVVCFIGIAAGKEKRNRLYLKSPVSVRQIGMVRIFIILFIWIGFVALFFLFLLISGSISVFFADSSLYLCFCTLTGAAFFWTAYVIWMNDLKTYIDNKKKVLGISLKNIITIFIKLSLVIIYLFFLFSPHFIFPKIPGQSLKSIFNWLYESVPGVIFFLMVGIGVSLLSVVSFGHRKSYVE